MIRLIFYNKITRKIFKAVAKYYQRDCMEVLGSKYNETVRFSDAKFPKEINGFEDLVFLFWPSLLNRGLIRMDLDEAAYLYKTIKALKNPTGVEIGRFKGGSTFLLAQAMNEGRLISLDLHLKLMLKSEGKSYDQELKNALSKYGLEKKVQILVADSSNYPNSSLELDYIFIDGDHSYEGVKKDYLHWIQRLKKSSDIFIHDACSERDFSTEHREIAKFVQELRLDERIKKISQVGSLVHFKKIY